METTRACSVEVRFDERGDRRVLAPRADHVAYRVVQESLANVIRHGGPGSTAEVSLVWQPDHLQVVVNSRSGSQPTTGVANEHSGHGLEGLRARVGDLGGTFASGATGDGGFLVSAQVPYNSGLGRSRAASAGQPPGPRSSPA
jgi:signal transduction histidine kinase